MPSQPSNDLDEVLCLLGSNLEGYVLSWSSDDLDEFLCLLGSKFESCVPFQPSDDLGEVLRLRLGALRAVPPQPSYHKLPKGQ